MTDYSNMTIEELYLLKRECLMRDMDNVAREIAEVIKAKTNL